MLTLISLLAIVGIVFLVYKLGGKSDGSAPSGVEKKPGVGSTSEE